MQFIPTRVHGIVDYLSGLLLIAAPWLLGFADGGAAQWTAVAAGVAVLGLSVLTDYELGLTRVVPMSAHLALDAGLGVLLAASPWLFGFSHRVWLPHAVIGVFEVLASFVTRRTPDDAKTGSTRRVRVS